MTTEKAIDPPCDVNFGKLELLFGEPQCMRVFDEINVWNNNFRKQPLSPHEIDKVVTTFDSQWEEYLNKKAIISGTVSFYGPYDQNQRNPAYYSDEPMIFNGALAVPIKPEVNDYENDENYELDENLGLYQLRIMLLRSVTLGDGSQRFVKGIASIEDISDPHFTEYISFERAKGILDNYCPDVLESLNDIASLAQDESEIIFGDGELGLNTLSVDIKDFDADTLDLVQRSLDAYTNRLLKFDTIVPHSVVASGDMWVFDENNAIVLRKQEYKGLASLFETAWKILSDEREGDRLVPCIKTLFFPGHSNEDFPAEVPAATFRSVHSVRGSFSTD